MNRFSFLGYDVDIGYIESDIAFRNIVLDVDKHPFLAPAANPIQIFGDRLDRILVVAQWIDNKEKGTFAYDRRPREGFWIGNGRFG